MHETVKAIIEQTDYENSCRGLDARDLAADLCKSFFENEGLSFDNWQVVEIPFVDNNNKYPVAVVVCLQNNVLKQYITVDITAAGKLFNVCPDFLETIDLSTIKEALSHPESFFKEEITEEDKSDWVAVAPGTKKVIPDVNTKWHEQMLAFIKTFHAGTLPMKIVNSFAECYDIHYLDAMKLFYDLYFADKFRMKQGRGVDKSFRLVK